MQININLGAWKQGVERLRQEWNENPVVVIGVVAMAGTAAAKLVDALSAAQGRRAYAKQINHKVKKES